MTQTTLPGDRIRVLCVDDNADIREAFELLMQFLPEFEVVACLESADGLVEFLGQRQPDIVLLDLSMPGRDPLEAMIESRAKFPDVQFLVLSAYDDARVAERAIQSGAAGYRIKDGDFAALMTSIREIASRSQAR